MEGDVVGLVTLDFVLRYAPARMVNVAFVIDVSSVDFDYFSVHPARFRIPAYVIADFERSSHDTARTAIA